MEFYELFGFVMVLSKAIKLVPKNGKLMGLVATFSLVLSSSLFLLFNYSFQSLVIHMFVNYKQSFMPNHTPRLRFDPVRIIHQLGRLREDLALLFIVQIAYYFLLSITSFFSTLATILVSSMSYSSKTTSLKDLCSRIRKTWTKLMITTIYVSLLSTGYSVFVVMLVVPIMMYPNTATFCVAILLGIAAFVVELYLLVGWRMAIVVSVLEESCYGVEALRKAEQLVKGKRLHGFLLNVFFNFLVLVLIVSEGFKILLVSKGFLKPTSLSSLFLVNVSFMLKMLAMVAYTVLYFRCKKHHGEEIELHLQYDKLPTTQMKYPK